MKRRAEEKSQRKEGTNRASNERNTKIEAGGEEERTRKKGRKEERGKTEEERGRTRGEG